ncbi:MAG: hypothetical protein AB8G05_13490 [Oligoflexales bacterium]
MPRNLVMFAGYFILLFCLSCSSQSFKPGKSNSGNSNILSKDAIADQDSNEDQLEPDDDDAEEEIVAVPPAVISGSFLVCNNLSSDLASRSADISCYFEKDGNKVDISSVGEFEILVKDEYDNSLDFSYSIIDAYHIKLKVELQDSNTISIAILDAKTGTGQHSDPMDAFGLTKEATSGTNESQAQSEEGLPNQVEEIQETESSVPAVNEESTDQQVAEIEYVVILMPGETLDTDSPRPCSLNGQYCLFLQNDRNLVVRSNPGGDSVGATGTTYEGRGRDYRLRIQPDHNLCIRTIDRDRRSRDICFGTQNNQFAQDPILILTNLGELKLVSEDDPSSSISIVIPGEFNPF